MMFLYTIIITAVVLYIRFFILNALITAAARKATLYAALKAAYFIPLFLQGLLLLWIGVVHFFTTCKDFLVLFNYWAYNSIHNGVYDFLYRLSFILSASLLLSLHYILGKFSLNKKADALNVILKAVYITASYFIIQVMLLNAGLAHPITPNVADIVVFNNPYAIAITCLTVVAVIILSFSYKNRQSFFRYVQLGILISTGYIIICLLTGLLLFLLHTLLKLIH